MTSTRFCSCCCRQKLEWRVLPSHSPLIKLLQELGVHVDGNDDMEQQKPLIPKESLDSENSKDLIGDNDDNDDFDENDIRSRRTLRRTRRRGKRLANAN
jgi:hypothetical protein